jgi:hypothetical protein
MDRQVRLLKAEDGKQLTIVTTGESSLSKLSSDLLQTRMFDVFETIK